MLLSFEEFAAFTPQRETYALFGYPLGHTMSPALHAALFAAAGRDADYIAVTVPPEKLAEALALAREKLAGINLTIPHKKAVIPLLDEVDPSAADLHSVNTVAFRDCKAIGFNTDILGFAESLEKDSVSLRGKKVLLLGYGGAAAVMAYHCLCEGATLYITGRNLDKAEALRAQLLAALPHAKCLTCTRRRIPKDVQIVLNATPLGMFPREDKTPLYFLPHKVGYVFDAIYNPPVTALMRLANPKRTKTRDGLFMLVMQAARAQTIWYGAQFADGACDSILRRMYGQMAVKRLHDKYHKRHIVLCGFMGSGKTTVGRKVARLTGLPFVDLDRYIEAQEGLTIPEIFAQHGEAYFRDLETKYVTEVTARQEGCVLSLGGGAVLRPENVAAIKRTGLLILLDTPFFRILKNLSYSTGRPLLEKENRAEETRRLYQSRRPIYEQVADCRVRSPRLGEVVERTLKAI